MVNKEKFSFIPGGKKPELKGEGEAMSASRLIPAEQMQDKIVAEIISEQIGKGLKTEEMDLREKGAAATRQILQYLLEKYTIEERDGSGPRRNLDLFKFAAKGPDKDNLFRLNRFLKEKAGFEIDFSDHAIAAIGGEAMGPDNFRRYLNSLALETEREEENGRARQSAV